MNYVEILNPSRINDDDDIFLCEKKEQNNIENLENEITTIFTKENQREDEDSSIYDYQIKVKENNIIENIDNHTYINNFQKTYTCQDIIKILKNIRYHPDIISLIKPEHLRKKDIDNTKYFGIKRPRQRRNKKIKSKEKNKKGRKLKFGNEKGNIINILQITLSKK